MMERNWIYKDDLGSEYGPYSREELERYAREGRVSHKGMIKDPDGNWSSPEDAGLVLPSEQAASQEPNYQPLHPATDSRDAIREAEQAINYSESSRVLYICLGIGLPLVTGLAGINNLIVGRTGPGIAQLALSLGAYMMFLIGAFLVFPICIAIPMMVGVIIWSIVEAATNDRDGMNRVMK